MDFVVVGGGIAGLAIAELLQRSGAATLLVERRAQLCGEAAAEQHGWFHTGALYAALPRRVFLDALRRNVEDVLDYYACFPNMNLHRADDEDGAGPPRWFSGRRICFAYADPREVGWADRLPWELSVRLANQRLARGRIPALPGGGPAPLRRGGLPGFAAEHGLDLREARLLCDSQDRVMHATAIARDLADSFVTHGGQVRLGTTVTRDGGRWAAVRPDGARVPLPRVRHVVVTVGRWAARLDEAVRIVASPILVTTPPVTRASLAFMSPRPERTVNHVLHEDGALAYSVVGNGAYYDPAGLPGLRRAAEAQIRRRAQEVMPQLHGRRVGYYFGYKTERPHPGGTRSYASHLQDMGGYTLALPGKYSLCFSLAVRTCRHLGVEPVPGGLPLVAADLSRRVAETRHLRLARRLAA